MLSGGPGAEITAHKDLLFAVNAGSNNITVFRTHGARLTRVGSPVSSGGIKPTSLTVNGDLLYVLNSGLLPLGEGVGASITGFTIGGDGTLTPIPDSSRTLSGGLLPGAAEVAFDPSGQTVSVSERTPGIIDTFTVQGDGTLSQAISGKSSGQDPFGFAESRAHPGRLVVAQGNFPPPLEGAASSYQVDTSTGQLATITGNLADQQSDSCWVVLSKGERFAYVTSFFSNEVSSYTVGDDGTLRLLHADAGSTGLGIGGESTQAIGDLLNGVLGLVTGSLGVTTGIGVGANDEAISSDGRYLYARDFVDGSIAGFKINANGTLKRLGNFASVGAATGFGLAAS